MFQTYANFCCTRLKHPSLLQHNVMQLFALVLVHCMMKIRLLNVFIPFISVVRIKIVVLG